MDDLTKLTIKEAAAGLRKKEFSSKELAASVLGRIKKFDKRIQAYLLVTEDSALKQAEKADKLLAENSNLPTLIGIPYGLKDIIVTKGIRTTAGSKILSDFIPPYSATVYEKLEAEKAVLLGKTNMDEFGMGASTENSAYQVTKNPWDLLRVPGGSSGGSAAAVAADMAIFSIGSDTGGSVRQPSSFCGTVGFKPTYGLVSRYGLIAMASSLEQIGLITKNVEDASIVLNTIAGYDNRDANSVEKEITDYENFLKDDIKDLKIGVPKEFLGKGVDSKVKDTIERAVKELEKLGAKLVELSLPRLHEAIAVYYLIMPSEVSANMARFDGIRFGKERSEFGPEVKRRIMLGTYALSSGYFDAYYLKAAKVRTLIREEFQEAFKKVDVIVGPTSPILPFKIGERVDDPLQMYLADILTVPVNLAGLPAISIPCGLVDDLPVGLQIIGNLWEEGKILNTAQAFEKNYPFREKPKL